MFSLGLRTVYIRKSENASASYAIIDAEAAVYGLRGLYRTGLKHRRHHPSAERARRADSQGNFMLGALDGLGELRNPAYKGTACFNKTKSSKRQRITRPIRLRGGIASRDSVGHERPRAEWIEIPVPPIMTEETFALAEERLQDTKDHALRRTITPSVVQGLVSCRKCSYGFYRTSTRTSARMIHYYRCVGSDSWRYPDGPVCDMTTDLCDKISLTSWYGARVVKLLESPQLIQEVLERRLTAARNKSPTKRREDTLQRELARVQKSADRLMTAYQEDLLSLDDLRRRMPDFASESKRLVLS
jgi:site-specific DNA recombinase